MRARQDEAFSSRESLFQTQSFCCDWQPLNLEFAAPDSYFKSLGATVPRSRLAKKHLMDTCRMRSLPNCHLTRRLSRAADQSKFSCFSAHRPVNPTARWPTTWHIHADEGLRSRDMNLNDVRTVLARIVLNIFHAGEVGGRRKEGGRVVWCVWVVVVVRTRVWRTCLCRYERTAHASHSGGRSPGSQTPGDPATPSPPPGPVPVHRTLPSTVNELHAA